MIYLTCTACHQQYESNKPVWRCECGQLLFIEYFKEKEEFPVQKITGRKCNMWRYREAIPLEAEVPVVSFEEGFTPLLPVEIAGQEVWVKQEHLFPSGSYKDRGAAVMVSKLKSWGVSEVVEDSSGNAGASIAAYCAAAGIRCHIYVPASTAAAKLTQIEAYGAILHPVPGTREDTAQAALAAAEDHYYASHTWNPYFLHGTKTFAYEVCEQLGWQAPDVVILPVGNGTLYIGAYFGFLSLQKAGVIAQIPRLIGVQALLCSPLYEAFAGNDSYLRHYTPRTGNKTVAEGIAIAAPIRGNHILSIVKSTDGMILTVTEEEILAAHTEILKKGFYIEPTTAAGIAGAKVYLTLPRFMSKRKETEVVVTAFTGHGLKSAK